MSDFKTQTKAKTTLKFKKLNSSAVAPKQQKVGDAGYDITCTSITQINPYQLQYGTDLAVEIPEGYFGMLVSRSSIAGYDLSLSNCLGIIDFTYRGELKFVFNKVKESRRFYQLGDRIGQLVIVPYASLETEEITELSETVRGTNGYGSSGK